VNSLDSTVSLIQLQIYRIITLYMQSSKSADIYYTLSDVL